MTTLSFPIYSVLASDPDLREVVRLFVEEIPERMQVFENELVAEHWPELQRVAHQLKGTAGSHGFAELSKVAAALESTIQSNAGVQEIAAATANLIAVCQRATAEPSP